MIVSTQSVIVLIAASTALAGGLFWNGTTDVEHGLVSVSEARVGRPLTPMSYAGVARRTTRRAVVYGGAAAAAGAYAVTPGCAQVTNAYGQIYTRC